MERTCVAVFHETVVRDRWHYAVDFYAGDAGGVLVQSTIFLGPI